MHKIQNIVVRIEFESHLSDNDFYLVLAFIAPYDCKLQTEPYVNISFKTPRNLEYEQSKKDF